MWQWRRNGVAATYSKQASVAAANVAVAAYVWLKRWRQPGGKRQRHVADIRWREKATNKPGGAARS